MTSLTVLEHVKWIRSIRAGAIQTPEQLLDGVELSATLIDAVVNKLDEARAK
jgi:hypothetical protein